MRTIQSLFFAAALFTPGISAAMTAPNDPDGERLPPDDVPTADANERAEPRDPPDPAPEADEVLPRCEHDGCKYQHQGCVCSNTGWNGYCGFGPHHPGCLYCRCD